MNEMPINWASELKEAYPARSGVSGWGSVRLMLALRRALMESTWEQILDGCKNYKSYTQKSGIEGSAFVMVPKRFIEDGCYLETFEYKAPEDPKVIEAKRKEQERWERARLAGENLREPQRPYQHESIGAFETRIHLVQTSGGDRGIHPKVSQSIAALTARMKRA